MSEPFKPQPDERAQLREKLRAAFEQRLEATIDRHLAATPHGLIPNHHFAPASAECIDSFRAGHFIACVALVQAVAEGIARFVCLKRALKHPRNQKTRVSRLATAKLISPECAGAFGRISSASRDDIHHMNPAIPTEWTVLHGMAEQALKDLAIIESEIFAFDFDGGRLVPKQPEYWDIDQSGATAVFLRLGL